MVFCGNDIDGHHAADRFRLGHTAVTGRQRRVPNAKRPLEEGALRGGDRGVGLCRPPVAGTAYGARRYWDVPYWDALLPRSSLLPLD